MQSKGRGPTQASRWWTWRRSRGSKLCSVDSLSQLAQSLIGFAFQGSL